MRSLLLFAFTSLVGCASQAPQVAPVARFSTDLPAAKAQALAGVLESAVALAHVPGAQVALVDAEGRMWSAAAGFADEDGQQPLTVDDPLQIGSATKLMTAVCVLRLVDRGELSLDDTLDGHYPAFPSAERITVRHLLTHRAGLKEILARPTFLGRAALLRSRVWDIDAIIEEIEDDDLDFAPGSAFAYSNTNYIVLGGILQRVTGKPAHQVLHDELFGPLGMASTWMPPAEPPTARAPAFGIDQDFMPLGPHWLDGAKPSWTTLASTSGGVLSRASDVLRFYRALFGGQLVSEALREELTAFLPSEDLPEPTMRGYGLGLSDYRFGERRAWGHRGIIMGFDATPVFLPDLGVSLVVLTNHSQQDSTFGGDLVSALVDVLEAP